MRPALPCRATRWMAIAASARLDARIGACGCSTTSGIGASGDGGGEGDAVFGASASHAWVQVWHPELAWVGIDPTNDKLVDWQYVRIAVGAEE